MGEFFACLVGAVAFGVPGALLCRYAIEGEDRYERTLVTSPRSEGVVVAIRTDHDSDTPFKYPVVRFPLPSGEEIEFEASIRRDPPKYELGDRVPVFYDAANPRQADIAGTQSLDFTLSLLLGAPFLLAGLALLARSAIVLLG